jgi:hypothetical protein
MRKHVVFASAVLLLSGLAAAATSSTLHVTNSTVTAGQDNQVAEFEISASGNDTLNDLTPSISVPASYDITPSSVNSLSNDSQNFSLTITPESSFEPGDYSTEFKVSSQEQTFSETLNYNVPRVNQWNMTPLEAHKNVQTGEEGVLQNFTVFQEGNADIEVGVNLEGNISDIIDPVPPQNVYPDVNSSFDLKYNVGNSLQPGFYNGTLNVSQQSSSKFTAGNVSLNVSDNENPEFGLSDFEDVEATLSEDFKIKVTDNVEVDNVVGEVRREYEVETGSGNNTSTELRNESVKVLEFENTEGEAYSAEFSETEVIGDYYVTVRAEDTSGNEKEVVKEFEVTALESLVVPSDTVNFGSVVSGEEKRVEAFEVQDETEVNVSLNGVTPENASVEIGVREEDDSATRLLGDDGYVIVDEPGTYFIEAKPDGTKVSYRFNGEIEFDTVEQHVDVSDLFFEGKAILDYPEPRNLTVRGVEAMAFYTYDANGDPDKIVRKLVRDASVCRGLQDIKQCAGDPNLDKVDDQAETIEGLESNKDAWKFAFLFLGIVFVGYIGASRRRSKLAGLQKVQYEMDYGFSKKVPGTGVKKWNPESFFKRDDFGKEEN